MPAQPPVRSVRLQRRLPAAGAAACGILCGMRSAGRLARFAALSVADRMLLLRAFTTMVDVWLTLRASSWPAAERRLQHRATVRTMSATGAAASVDRLQWAVRTVACHVFRTTCLVQAIALQILLARSGRPSELRLGVHRAGDGLVAAHAWLECDGAVLIGEPPPASTPLPVPLDRRLFVRSGDGDAT